MTIIIGIAASAWCVQQPRIRLRELSTVNSVQFTLGDVATFEGVDAQMASRLKAVTLGTSPLPGLERTITREQVLIRLRQHGFQAETFEIVVPARITIQRTSHVLQADRVVEVAAQKLRQSASLPENAQVECDASPRALSLPHREAQITAGEPRALGAGLYMVPVLVACQETAPVTLNVRLRVKLWRDAVVATRAIRTGEAIDPSVVAVRQVAVSDDRDDFVTDISEVAGKIARRPISPGQPIWRTAVDEPTVIRRGQNVKLLVQLDGATIEAGAIAQQDGKAGDRIRVQVVDTRKTLLARVVDAQTVTLDAR